MKTDMVAIIGAGPAGIAAGIQLKRFGIGTVILEGNRIGGLLHNANLVENYPGFPDGVAGKKLAGLLEEQANKHSLNIVPKNADLVEYGDNCFRIKCGNDTIKSEYLIIASGTKPVNQKELEIPAGLNNRVLYEIDGLGDIKNRKIVIVGGGDAAFDYGLGFHPSNTIVIANRSEKTKCLELLKKRADNADNITCLAHTRLTGIEPGNDRLQVQCENGGGKRLIEADYVVFAIGRKPRLEFLPGGFGSESARLEDKGQLYFAGDVQNGMFRQAAIAVGDGVKAAMNIFARLKKSL